jgi:hypothetical protein
MRSNGLQMSGTFTFNTFAYLLNGASSLAKSAKEHPEGSNYCRVAAVAFSAFAVEAYLNHVGEKLLPFWSVVERLSWDSKLELLAKTLGLEPDFGRSPFQSLKDLFNFRNRLAHGRTASEDRSYFFKVESDDFSTMDPDWLKKVWSDEAVAKVLKDTRKVIETIHAAAGFSAESLAQIATGEFAEADTIVPEKSSSAS